MKPTYNGRPLSYILPIPFKRLDGPFGIWFENHQEPWADTLETMDALISQGYQQVRAREGGRMHFLLELLSQLCDFQEVGDDSVDPDKGVKYVWAKPADIDHVKRAPVILGFRIPDAIAKITGACVPMASFLPFPNLGDSAIVEESKGKDGQVGCMLYPYHLSDLGEKGLELHRRLSAAINALAGDDYPWITDDFLTQAGKVSKELFHTCLDALQASLDHPNFEQEWGNIQQMAKDLAIAYYEFHQAHGQDRPRPIPPISDVFANGRASIWTALPFQAYTEAASNAASGAKRWKEEQVSEHMFRISYTYNKPAGTTMIHLQSASDEQNAIVAREKVWQQVQALGDLDGDVFLSIVAQLLNGTRDKDGWTVISASKILDYRGIRPRTEKTESGKEYRAGHRQEDIEDIARCIARMRNTRVTVNQTVYEEPQPGSKRGKDKSKSKSKTYRYNRESPLFQFGDVITRQELWNDSASRPVEVAWQVKESSWMEPFIQGTNRMVGDLLKSCLEYDPHNEKWEKRLSRYIMFHLRTNSHSASITRNVGKLLEELSLEIDERYPMRAKDRFEKALDRLKKDGHISRWRYKEEIDLRARKWLTTWLTQDIVFTAPAIIDENTTPKALP